MKKKSFVPYIIAFFLFSGAFGYMVWSGLSEGSVYFLNVSEAMAEPVENSRSMRLFGTVSKYEKAVAGDVINFEIADAENPAQVIQVSYKGVLPDTFEHGVEVILEGNMLNNTSFDAKSLMTKCPSKYEKENRQS